MFAKISLTAAFLLMVAPPIACASNRNAASMTRHTNLPARSMVLAQDAQLNLGTSDNDNDSNDSADDNQDSGDNEAGQQNAAGEGQSIPPTVLGGPDAESGDAPQPPQINTYSQPIDPNQ